MITETTIARFWAKVIKTETCWEWVAAIDHGGYGTFGMGPKNYRAHRVSMMLAGKDPRGWIVDHMCRNRRCVNPDHLRFVTAKVNSTENSVGLTAKRAAQTHCKRGHPLAGDNLLHYRSYRSCAICNRLLKQEERRRRRAKQQVQQVAQ